MNLLNILLGIIANLVASIQRIIEMVIALTIAWFLASTLIYGSQAKAQGVYDNCTNTVFVQVEYADQEFMDYVIEDSFEFCLRYSAEGPCLKEIVQIVDRRFLIVCGGPVGTDK